jgi:hypothetical protein
MILILLQVIHIMNQPGVKVKRESSAGIFFLIFDKEAGVWADFWYTIDK